MKQSLLSRGLCCVCLALTGWAMQAHASAPPVPDNVHVHYTDPGQFTEVKRSFGVHANNANDYLEPLQQYIVRRASGILAPGQTLDINVTDVDRAGEYEPWHGPSWSDVRIIKDIYPPRIDLDFTLYGVDGEVLRHGSRSLRDVSFMNRGIANNQDSLRFEKALIDRWLHKGTGAL
ncbi:MAG: DUF3016 domain-containing protein [Rhodanobacter sp.]